jgi:hypothetical protein
MPRGLTAVLCDFVGVKGSSDFFDVSAVTADERVKLVACDAELLRPVGDVGRHLGVDLLGVVRALDGVVFFEGVGFVDFGIVVVLGHGVLPLFSSLGFRLAIVA